MNWNKTSLTAKLWSGLKNLKDKLPAANININIQRYYHNEQNFLTTKIQGTIRVTYCGIS